MTSYLAEHYFRRSPGRGKGTNLVITASCGGFYPSLSVPLYSAAKHGAVGFMRSIAPNFALDGIRVNAICPGAVQTNFLDQGAWTAFPSYLFISLDTICRVVMMLVDGRQDHDRKDGDSDFLVDAMGVIVPREKAYGRAVEISGTSFYFREQIEFCDEGMREVMGATSVENQMGKVLSG